MEKRLDDFHTPKPRKAAARTTVESVLSTVANVGTPLLSLLSGLLAAALILFSGYVLYDAFYTQEQAKSGWELLQYKPSIVEMQDDETPADLRNLLAEVNSDYRAWLTVYETNIDYPVVQGPDDLYYAYHDVYKETSLTGAIYLAAGNRPQMTDSYNLIYGHHMDNGAMFGGLDLYRQESYFDSHREGILVAQSAVYDLYAFAVAETDAYQDRIYDVGNRMNGVLSFLRANTADADPAGADQSGDTVTLFFDEAPLSGAAKIVALSTCASASTNGRLLVFYVATERDMSAVPTPTPDPAGPLEPEPTPQPTPQPDRTGQGGEEPPLDRLFGFLHPRGTGRRVWALVNLISLILTVYLFLPLLHLKAKFGRTGMMEKVNGSAAQLRSAQTLNEDEVRDKARLEELALAAQEDGNGDVQAEAFGTAVEALFYRAKRFRSRFSLGVALELVFAVSALVVFLFTENMRLPMVLIDRWTPLMIVLLLIVWVLDVRFIRYRGKVLADEEEAERQRAQEQAGE